MSEKLKVLAVCGFGIGTSLMLKMNIETVLKNNSIEAEVENIDITSAVAMHCDMIFTSSEFYDELKDKVSVPLIRINNFLSNKEIEEKAMPIIKEILFD
ncbi:PTS sugar transporter subunit IIB [Clostridium grantii]|uniref:PTS system IIB component, L-Asc family n=1 Tax=Clostridium grantii DSM 8605 TaxID=1121316 RepID=A0A1M5QEK4_9CLOT|nr:PTS sugar transporter subunit IIB [Clostridium grantii]SHH12281.1 PTS system IIB component, L-Asc family [Clostridium grantii DSM 8605]